MPLLEDVITKESVHALHKAFDEGVLTIFAKSEANSPSFSKGQLHDVGVPIMRWVHHQLMAKSVNNKTGMLPDYPRISTTSVKRILETEGAFNARFSGDIGRMLQYAGVARCVGRTWYLRDWSYANVRWIGSREWAKEKADPKVEKRIEEEADKPVVVKLDLRLIKRPTEFTPEAIGEWIDRFVPAALNLQERYDVLVAHHEEHHAEAEKGEWQGVASKIEEALNG